MKEPDRLGCAVEARLFLLALGVPRALALRAELCIAELSGNAARHASGGEVEVLWTEERIEIHVKDRGPGIADVALALRDGVSRGHQRTPDAPARGLSGSGTGLGAVSRTADRMAIHAREGGGLHAFAELNVPKNSRTKQTRKTA